MVVMKAQGILISIGMSFSAAKIMSQHTLGILISIAPLISCEYMEYHTSGYPWVSVYQLCQIPVYQVYQEDQDQISGATYISDVVF